MIKRKNFFLQNKKQIRSIYKQHGYLALIAIFMIVVIGFLNITLSYLFSVSSVISISNLQSNQAFYLAESGLEQAIRSLLTPVITNRLTCSSLNISNTLGAGAYTATGTGPFYNSSPATLTGTITATATTIPVSSASGYQSSGRIMIDNELINYASISGTNFIVAKRGADGTLASNHASGTRVGQYQCNLSSQGGVPSLSPSSSIFGGKRTLSESVQLQEGWAVGTNLSGSSWNVIHWNTPTEKQWTQQTVSVSSPQILTGISILSNVDAWAVGNKAVVLRYNGSTWSMVNTGITGGDNLTSVSAVSSQEVWACADQGKIYKWTPLTNWTSPSSPGNNPNSISMVDTTGAGTATAGWLVGAKKTAYRYNGTTWASSNTGITVDLNGVSTLSSTDAWAVGLNGAIYHWTGSWGAVSTPTSNTLNGISMIVSGSNDIGWAVGNSSTALYYDGTSWTSTNSGLASNLTLTGVVTLSSTEAWLTDSSGHVYEWNGSTWTLIFTSAKALSSIAFINPNNQPFSAWTEIFS